MLKFVKLSKTIFDAKIEECVSGSLIHSFGDHICRVCELVFVLLAAVLITITKKRLRRPALILSPLCLTERMSAPRRLHQSQQGEVLILILNICIRCIAFF